MGYHTINDYKECSVIISYQNSLTSTDQDLNFTSFSTAKVSGLASSPCSSSGTRSCHPRKPTECQCQCSSSRRLPQWHNGCLPKRSQNLRGKRKTRACRSRSPTSPGKKIMSSNLDGPIGSWFCIVFSRTTPIEVSMKYTVYLLETNNAKHY